MRFSRALIRTTKEDPNDASNVSHVLLTRAGYIRRVGAGMYDFLPLGLRVLRKVERIVRKEMDASGAEEILMPAMLPAEYFKETGRWDRFGDTLLRLKDRKGGDYHLGPTHEEIVTDIARREIHSWRDMPKNLYQIQTKFRDEPRPRGGLLRCREFVMKDAYSFDTSEEGAKKSYEEMRKAYVRIFDRLGLQYRMVAADSGAMGGSTSAEFQVLADSGEDAIVACKSCEYAANVEVATVGATDEHVAGPARPKEKVHTPGHGGIDDVVKFLGVSSKVMLKSLVYLAGDALVLAVVRGDHEVNEVRLARAAGVSEVFLASEGDVRKATGAKVGFAGPVGFKGKVFVDRSASLVKDGVTGANESDHHLVGVQYGRDFEGDVVDIRSAATGDTCPSCGAKEGLVSYKGIEGGHIFILGTHYSEKMGATFLDEAQKKQTMVMGCYGIGVSRLVATAIEQHHDDSGIVWPISIAPYQVHLVQIGKDEPSTEAASALYEGLRSAGLEVLWDDRDERPGVKFKDADLIGVPVRVTVGGKSLAAGNVELKLRTETDPKKADLIAVGDAQTSIVNLVNKLLS